MSWDLAQLNIGRLLAPTDHPDTKGFMDALEPINALADAAPGFLWRLQTEDGDATAIRPYDDDLMIVNMSTWASLEALADFVYGEEHRAIMVQRRQWFERMETYMVLWWVPAGPHPVGRRGQGPPGRARGSTARRPEAFTFRQPFPAPDAARRRRRGRRLEVLGLMRGRHPPLARESPPSRPSGPTASSAGCPGAKVHLVADRPGRVTTHGSKVALLADSAMGDYPSPDVVVVPGGIGIRRLVEDRWTVAWVKEAHETSLGPTPAVSTGSVLLAAAGVLEGDATTHWLATDLLEEQGRARRARADRAVGQGHHRRGRPGGDRDVPRGRGRPGRPGRRPPASATSSTSTTSARSTRCSRSTRRRWSPWPGPTTWTPSPPT